MLGGSLAVVAVLAMACGMLLGSLPPVNDAPDRVRAIDARHGSMAIQITRGSKIARAIIAVEDERFYDHGAVDPRSLLRAAAASIVGSADPGGSTIAQQLAKVLYVSHPASALGRAQAVALAATLEQRYSKTTILRMYLNAIYFGHGFYGIAAASRGYFDRSVDQLTWGQAALLAGLPQAPSRYDPFRHPRQARTRRREVLAQLVDTVALRATTARDLGAGGLGLRP